MTGKLSAFVSTLNLLSHLLTRPLTPLHLAPDEGPSPSLNAVLLTIRFDPPPPG
jgi:hypothetical protein